MTDDNLADLRRVLDQPGPKTIFASLEDAPGLTLAVESNDRARARFTVQGHPLLPPGDAVIVDNAILTELSKHIPDWWWLL